MNFLLRAALTGAVIGIAAGALAAETPKRGGTLTYMIPSDAPQASTGIARRLTRRCTPPLRSTAC